MPNEMVRITSEVYARNGLVEFILGDGSDAMLFEFSIHAIGRKKHKAGAIDLFIVPHNTVLLRDCFPFPYSLHHTSNFPRSTIAAYSFTNLLDRDSRTLSYCIMDKTHPLKVVLSLSTPLAKNSGVLICQSFVRIEKRI